MVLPPPKAMALTAAAIFVFSSVAAGADSMTTLATDEHVVTPMPAVPFHEQCSLLDLLCVEARVVGFNDGCDKQSPGDPGNPNWNCRWRFVWSCSGSSTFSGSLQCRILAPNGADSRSCNWTLPGGCSTPQVTTSGTKITLCFQDSVSATVTATGSAGPANILLASDSHGATVTWPSRC